jgi:hypothetical protein
MSPVQRRSVHCEHHLAADVAGLYFVVCTVGLSQWERRVDGKPQHALLVQRDEFVQAGG